MNWSIALEPPLSWPLIAAILAPVAVLALWRGRDPRKDQSDFLWRWVHQLHHSPSRIETITAFYGNPRQYWLDV